MYLLLMGIPVAGVIVSDVTTVSTSVWPELEVNIHLVLLQCLLFHKSFSAELTAMFLVLVPSVDCKDVGLHVLDLHTTQRALLRLLVALFSDMRLQTHFVFKSLATLVAAALLSCVFCVHVVMQPRGTRELLATELAHTWSSCSLSVWGTGML